MKFESFEEALKVCLTAGDDSPEQDEALEYCLKNAPPELKEILREKIHQAPGHRCGGNCRHEHGE